MTIHNATAQNAHTSAPTDASTDELNKLWNKGLWGKVEYIFVKNDEKATSLFNRMSKNYGITAARVAAFVIGLIGAGLFVAGVILVETGVGPGLMAWGGLFAAGGFSCAFAPKKPQST